MGQHRDAQKASANALREILGIEVPEDDGAFLSPEETDVILTSLEEKDQLMLGGGEPVDEEGVFISPEELEAPGAPPSDTEGGVLETAAKAERRANPEATRYGESVQSDLLSRIAGELRSIKSEIGSLKTTYDEMITKATPQESDHGAASAPETENADAAAESATEVPGNRAGEAPIPAARPAPGMPEEMLADLKKLLGYMDRLLESLPEDKIDEFARSEYFELYRKVFEYFDLA